MAACSSSSDSELDDLGVMTDVYYLNSRIDGNKVYLRNNLNWELPLVEGSPEIPSLQVVARPPGPSPTTRRS